MLQVSCSQRLISASVNIISRLHNGQAIGYEAFCIFLQVCSFSSNNDKMVTSTSYAVTLKFCYYSVTSFALCSSNFLNTKIVSEGISTKCRNDSDQFDYICIAELH